MYASKTPGDRLLVPAGRQHVLAPLAHDDRGAGVLAHGQHTRGGDVGVLEQVEGDEPVVVGGLGVVDDPTQLGEVGRAQVVRDVVHGLVREGPQRLAVHLERAPARTLERPDTIRGQQAVLGVVWADGQQVFVLELSHGARTPRWALRLGVSLRRRSADVRGSIQVWRRRARGLPQQARPGAGPADRSPARARARRRGAPQPTTRWRGARGLGTRQPGGGQTGEQASNESPAPTVSTTVSASVGAEASSPVALRPNTAPSAPRVTTTRDGPSWPSGAGPPARPGRVDEGEVLVTGLDDVGEADDLLDARADRVEVSHDVGPLGS